MGCLLVVVLDSTARTHAGRPQPAIAGARPLRTRARGRSRRRSTVQPLPVWPCLHHQVPHPYSCSCGCQPHMLQHWGDMNLYTVSSSFVVCLPSCTHPGVLGPLHPGKPEAERQSHRLASGEILSPAPGACSLAKEIAVSAARRCDSVTSCSRRLAVWAGAPWAWASSSTNS